MSARRLNICIGDRRECKALAAAGPGVIAAGVNEVESVKAPESQMAAKRVVKNIGFRLGPTTKNPFGVRNELRQRQSV
jgi:hypothetical protein